MKSSDHFDIYNVGSGVETSINELTSILRELTQINFSVFYTENRKWDKISRRVANISKIQKKLNYSPRIDLKPDLVKTIIWYKKHHM
jgi:UDP-glucose 4-epimerase